MQSQRAAAIALAAEKAARRVTRVPAAAAAEVTRLTERLPPAGARKQDMKCSDITERNISNGVYHRC